MTGDEDDRDLLRRWRDNHDEQARLELVERTLPLARTLARLRDSGVRGRHRQPNDPRVSFLKNRDPCSHEALID